MKTVGTTFIHHEADSGVRTEVEVMANNDGTSPYLILTQVPTKGGERRSVFLHDLQVDWLLGVLPEVRKHL